MADALSTLTQSYLAVGRTADAIAAATAAHDLAIELDNKFSLPWAMGALGAAYQAKGDFQRAVSIHREALANAEQLGATMTIWSMHQYLGSSLLAAGDTDGALATLQFVVEAATARNDHLYMVDTLDHLADVALAVDDPETAISYLTRALTLADEHMPSRSPGLRERLAKLTE
jgi:tetratricopeptide (TPR) repeat protein